MRKVRAILTLAIFGVVSICIACSPFNTSFATSDPADPTSSDSLVSSGDPASPSPTASGRQSGYGAWVPYWDYASAIDELDEVGKNLSDVICFAAIFNASDQVFLLPDTQEAQTCLNILYSEEHTIYLSVVNDVEKEESVYENKSTDLLWRLLGSDTSIDAHIEDLMTVLHASKAEGLEIDYEAIRSDTGLCTQFALFIERLYQRTSAEGIPLRVVLSWDSALYATFPEGPQYSIMCYNLYGPHSGPGPKADRSFLSKVFSVNHALPGRPAIAFATGGFDWSDDGSVVSLTQSAAVALQSMYAVPSDSVLRDEESQALSFHYIDELGLSHEVWYSDGTTLSYWRSLASNAGYVNFDLFRLGGNSLSDLTAFFVES
ncbi:MAG: hypothetical protein VB034_00095 [Eubacteriales bacterium]|nr:hypothetical protein [Eubacteriales bacterium]